MLHAEPFSLPNHRLYPLFLLLLLLLLTQGSLALKIGVIIDADSRIGRVQKVAIELAVQQLNTSKSPIFLNLTDVSETNLLAVASAVEGLAKDWNADAILGTNSWSGTALAADVISRINASVPFISFASSTRMPYSLASSWHFLFQMSSQLYTQMQCIASFVKSYHWHRVIVIYEDGTHNFAADDVVLLFNAFQDLGVEIEYHATFNQHEDSIRERLEKLKNRQCKIFIVIRASPSLVAQLFINARVLGMMGGGYVWITSDNVTSHLMSISTTSTFSPYIQGVVGVTTYINDSTQSYQHFRKEFNARILCKDRIPCPGIFAARAYDAIHVIAFARKKTVNISVIGVANTIHQGISSSNFEGLSGRILFTANGDLAANTSDFVIINFIGKGYVEAGFWSVSTGFYDAAGVAEQTTLPALGPFIWPGRRTEVPSGWGTLRVGVPAHAFDQFVKVVQHKETKQTGIEGFCIDVFEEVARALPYDLSYKFLPFYGTYDELVSQVVLGVYDAAAGDITILPNRATYVDFTQPFMDSVLAMMVPLKPDDNTWMFIRPFTKAMWVAIALATMYTVMVTWFLECRANPTFINKGWLRQLGNVLITICFGYGRLHNILTRVVILAWFFAVFILMTSYTASLSSILTVQKLQPEVSYRRIGIYSGSNYAKYIQRVLRLSSDEIQSFLTEEEWSKALQINEITAMCLETPYLRVFLSKHSDEYVTIGETHRIGGFGFAFSKGSLLAEDFSRAILNLTQEGRLKEIERKWFSFSLSNAPSPDMDISRGSLDLDSFWVLFVITGGTSTLVIFVFLLQLLHRYKLSRQENKIVPEVENSRHLDGSSQES